ncbi:MAG: TPM domain-containing protein, partial [bacterium]
VNDFAGLLSQSTREDLAAFLTAYEAGTSNAIIVVTVPSLEDDVIENYAVELFKAWGIGQAKKDNGVLLLVAPAEREARIEVGYGLEGEITDLEAGQIINRILIPAFKQNDFDGGISSSVHALVSSIDGEFQVPVDPKQQREETISTIIFIIIFLLFIFLRIYARKKGKKGGGSGLGPFIGGFLLGGGGGSGGSGFGGFGGGSSGGGGASGKW